MPISPVDLANGMEWTRDDSIMFFTDSLKRVIYALDFDSSNGTVANQRIAIDFANYENALGKSAVPDGCCLDTCGRLWSTCYYGGCIACFDLVKGEIAEIVKIPTACTTSCCFGGPFLNQMFVTSAPEDVEGNKLGGSLFRVDGINVKGYLPYPASIPLSC